MFDSAGDAPGEDPCMLGSARELAAVPSQAIGKIQTMSGSVRVTRDGGVVVQGNVGDHVYQGDAIETSADGAVTLIFNDGTAFNLSASSRMVLDEFVCDPNGASNSARFNVGQGIFAFIAGKVAKAGRLSINTPVAKIRSAAQGGGTGIVTLAALTFAVIDELQAHSPFAFLDDDLITYKDLPHGIVEVVINSGVNAGQRILVDDPGIMTVVDSAGTVTRIALTGSRVAELQQLAHAVSLLAQDPGAPGSGGPSGSGATSDFLRLLPINFEPPSALGSQTITPYVSPFIETPLPAPILPHIPVTGTTTEGTPTLVTGTLAALGVVQTAGPDGLLGTFDDVFTSTTFSLSSDTSGLPKLMAGGTLVSYSVAGNVLTASAGGETAFTLTVNPDGSFSFTLIRQLDHVDDGTNSANVALQLAGPGGGSVNSIDFSSIILVGDTPLSSGFFSVTVVDATPTANVVTAPTATDDDVQTEFPGNLGGSGDAPDTNTVSGGAGALFSAGADGEASISFTPPSLFTVYKDANGFAVTEAVTFGDPVTSAGGVTTLTGSSEHNGTVVTLVVNADGSYTFTQSAPLVHPTSGANEENLAVAFGFTVTDGDGDTASGSLTINVNDDTPTVSENAPVQLDDDALTGGNPGGTGDDADSENVSGTLGASFGADGGSIAFLTTGAPAGFSYELSGSNLLVMQGTTTVLTVTLNAATGAYTVRQNAPIVHAAGLDENNQAFTLTYRVTDGDGDTVDGTLGINVDDDTPIAISPEPASLPNSTTGTVTVALDNSVGADGPGTLTFVNIIDGEPLTDVNGIPLTSGGDSILLFVTEDGTVLEGRTGSSSGPLIFTVTLNHNVEGSDTYTVTMIDTVDNGSGIAFSDLSGGVAGNPPFKIITEPDVTELALLFTPINAGSINSDRDDAGVGSQFIEPNQGLRIDFGAFTDNLDGSFTINSHPRVPIDSFKFSIDQVANGTHADVRLRAVDANEDNNFADDTTVAITVIEIRDPSGALLGTFSRQGVDGGDGMIVLSGEAIRVDFEAGGTVLITGLPADYSILTRTGTGYDRIEITNAGGDTAGDGKFSVSKLSIEQPLIGDPVNMAFDVALTDADGDSVVNTIDITLNPILPNSIAPAGVAGEPINLGLTAPSAEDGALVTVAIADVPAGWTLNGGTLLDDGTWTVQTTAPRSLAITSPAAFAGAMLLNVTATWAQADGSTAKITIADNVEVFAPGSPIFAWSGDDHLTGSSGDDLFVFAQPIGHDVIHNFDAAHDQVDLIAFAGMTSYADVQANIANDASGQAVLTLGDGMTVTFVGVDATALGASNFAFNQEPVTNNSGTMLVSDGAMLPLGGIVNNTGTIALDSGGAETKLELIQHGITLQGGGQLTLSDSGGNVIFGTDPSVTLTNVDNTISGAGQLGGGQMTLVNHGTIVATGSNALIIDTGANAVINSGTLEAVGSGGLVIHADVENSGLLWANGGNLTVIGDVSGDGSAKIDGIATIEFGAAFDENFTFDISAAGTLKLDDADTFAGVISGFDGNDQLDLSDIDFGTGLTLSYASNQGGTGGTLTLSDGTDTANINLVGQYSAEGFRTAADSGTGTLVTYMPSEGAGKNVVVGGMGTDDILSGGAGADTFQFAPSLGHDTIVNFEPGVDKIDFDLAIFATVDDILAHTQQVGSDVVITVDQANSVTLTNVSTSTLSASDFVQH
jgi:T1SS-143 domain-containing protein